MRILTFTDFYTPRVGGVEVLLSESLLPALVEQGHDVAVITGEEPDLPSRETIDGVDVHRVDLRGAIAAKDPKAVLATDRRIRDVRRSFDADVVHVHAPGIVAWFEPRSREPGRPVVFTVHVTFDHGGTHDAMGAAIPRADRIITVSEAVRADVTARFPDVEPTVIRNVVPLPAEPAPVPLDPPVLVAVGRLVTQKGYDTAVRALRAVVDRRPDATLVFVGSGPEQPRLTTLAESTGIADRIEWKGRLPRHEVVHALDGATLVLMPSRSEGMPLVALEAAAHGRVVIGSRIPGIAEVVRDGETGVLTPPGDPDALAAAVISLLDEPHRLHALGRAAREWAAGELSVDRYVRHHLDVYRSLVSD